MEQNAGADDPLKALFSGKRQWPRLPCARDVRLESAAHGYVGSVLDLSEGGVLFAMEDEAFYQGAQDGFSQVQQAFPQGPEVVFPREGVRVASSVVRITPYDGERVALGCHFERPLTDGEVALLGLHVARVEHPEGALAALPFAPRPSTPASVLLFAGREKQSGPRCLGRIRGVGERVVEADVVAPLEPPLTLAEALASQPLRAALVVGRDRAWEGPVHLMDLHVAPSGQAMVFRLFAGEALGRRVHKRFARRR